MHIGVGACVEEGVKKVPVKFSGLDGISEFTIALNMQKFDHFRGLGGISEFTIALNMQKFNHFRGLGGISEFTIALNMQKFDHFRGLGGISEFTIALNMQNFDHFRDLACILGSLGNDCIKIASITISCLKNTPRCAGAFSFSSFTSAPVLVYPEN